jgi:hypothetical protein
VAVAEQPAPGVAVFLLRIAPRPSLVVSQAANSERLQKKQLAAGDDEGHDDAVAALQARDAAAGVLHHAHEFMAEDVAVLHVGILPR